MQREQLAHDLAIAKLYGSDKQTKELIDQYRKYYNEILSVLNSEPRDTSKATIVRSPL